MGSAYSRRHMLSLIPAAGLGGWALLAGCKPEAKEPAPPSPAQPDAAARRLAELEKSAGGRLGVALLDAATGRATGHRAGERFAMCSTFKWPLSAVVLKAIDDGKLTLDQPVRYGAADLLAYAPVTRKNVGRGAMTVAELMEATITTSDNTAANLLLPLIGGPAGMTRQFRAWGDTLTRLDRMEPEMNLVSPDDVRDTTTPAAMAALLRTILLGDALSSAARTRLVDWGVRTTTGPNRLRAGVPAAWRFGHKTGTATGMAGGIMNKYNDIAVAFPPKGAPLLIAAYYEGPVATEDMRAEDEAVLASVGRIAAEWAGGR